ncbi:diacylglycerol kinase family protein [Lactiplantibacillus garii]|uniref:Diacylglycerol kinase family protein n=1 Tax=Lactiplantibacillus garii TaxID=2306423 RepID=A0A426D612_9LACO|nr:diacylglycerol kinase family protein [Lactiplantibacillus garii]RRK10030.1 diacylglycerol kinase family protein [Lactiplantibacillus garii]
MASKNRPDRLQVGKNHSFWQSWLHAWNGLKTVVVEERNMRTHLVLGVLALLLGWWVNLTVNQWLWLCLVIFMVMLCEINNTIAENICDLVTGPHYHPLAKKVKDIAAGAVVFAAAFAVLVGLILFVPKLWPLLMAWL